jgi:uncharacterized MAPEG superfamily protein
MTIAAVTLLAAVILTLLSIGPAKFDGSREYDNANPRDPGFYRPGLRARAQGARQNGFESFPFFAAAVILAELRQVPLGTLDALAIGFLIIRVVFVLLYLGNRLTLRSIAWSAGFGCNVAIFFMPVWA